MREQGMMYELGALVAASPILRLLGRGDHHPVFVMPGFLGDDSSTLPLRFHLRAWGYWAHGMRGGQNLGPTPQVLAGIDERLVKLHGRHGRKVSLVGWSLGGIYARELAKRAPECVRQVITLGTPFAAMRGATHAEGLYKLLNGNAAQLTDALASRLRATPPVPTTSVFSKSDGVVCWRGCIEQRTPLSESVEVGASHLGMVTHPEVLRVVVDRLAQPEGRWRPIRRGERAGTGR